MSKSYYVILGIAPDATPDEIKSAYREKAKSCHPDHTGKGSEPFLAIREAYEVLCDPGRRRAYDEERARREVRRQPFAPEPRPSPLRRAHPPVEPLVPGPQAGTPRDPFPEPSLFSLIEELVPGAGWGLNARVRPRGQRGFEETRVEVSLTREQARRGGQFRVWVPVQVWCPSCQGRGGAGSFACPHCLGSGTVVDHAPADITFPGGVVDGSEGRVSLARPGMRDLVLVLRFRIAE